MGWRDEHVHEPELRKTRLVQTLEDPPVKNGGQLQNLHRGFVGPRLSEAGWDLVDSLFGIHYMGAAEYEDLIMAHFLIFFQTQAHDYVTATLGLRPQQIKEAGYAGYERKPRVVYYICHKDHAEQVPARLVELAKDKPSVKRGGHFARALHPSNDYDKKYKGFIEYNNAFLFFTDEDMYKKVCERFCIEPAEHKHTANRPRKKRRKVCPTR